MKQFLSIIALLALSLCSWAQGSDWDAQWKKIDNRLKERQYKSASTEAHTLFDKACKENNQKQMLLGAKYIDKADFVFKEDAPDSSLVRYRMILPRMQGVYKALCLSYIADFYGRYYQNNSWKIYLNTKVNDSLADFKLWDKERFLSTIKDLAMASISDEALLKSTPSEDYKDFLIWAAPNDTSLLLTPTMYDVLVRHAINEIEGNKIKIELFDRLREFHSQDDDCIRLQLDYEFVNNYSVKDTRSEMRRLRMQYAQSGCEILPLLYYNEAAELDEWSEISDDIREEYIDEGDTQTPESNNYRAKAIELIDSALMLFPNARNTKDLKALREQITRPSINLLMVNTNLPNRNMLAVIESRNVDTLYFRIIGSFDKNRTKANLLKARRLKEWSMKAGRKSDYSLMQNYAYLPPMPDGDYILLCSPDKDFGKELLVYSTFTITDIYLLRLDPNEHNGYLISRTTGNPLADIPTKVVDINSGRVVERCKTDQNGYFSYTKRDRWYIDKLVIEHNGVQLTEHLRSYRYDKVDTNNVKEGRFFLDRPIYKPGDTLRFSYLVYTTNKSDRLQAAEGVALKACLKQGDGVAKNMMDLTTDSMGLTHGWMVLPDKIEAGFPTLYIYDSSRILYSTQQIRMEEYKQPKFEVAMLPDTKEHRFGEEIEVEGVASSYSGARLSGAKVKWSVERHEMTCWWKSKYHAREISPSIVDSGIVACNDMGGFAFRFTPYPDSAARLELKPNYIYEASVEVTDINGETHTATQLFVVGYESGSIFIIDNEITDRKEISYELTNLNHDPMPGTVNVTIEELILPQKAYLPTDRFPDTLTHRMRQDQFEKMYPQYDYSGTYNHQLIDWPSSKVIKTFSVEASVGKPNKIDLSFLRSGCYRVNVSSIGKQGDTMKHRKAYCLNLSDTKTPYTQEILYCDIDKTACNEGDIVHLRLGTRHKDLTVLYWLQTGKGFTMNMLKLNDEMKTLSIPVTKDMVGNFKVLAFAMKENHSISWQKQINVERKEKKLDVKFVTFRDKLTPGAQERWTISVSDNQGKGVLANLQLRMYDEALNSYGTYQPGWSFFPYKVNSLIYFNPTSNQITYTHEMSAQRYIGQLYYGPRIQKYDLDAIQLYSSYVGGRKGYRTKASNQASATYLAEVVTYEEEEVFGIEDEVSVSIEYAPSGTARGESGIVDITEAEAVVMDVDGVGYTPKERKDQTPKVSVRSNLSTLAFVEPTLRTDREGVVEYSFRVPDLLTRWQVDAVAWTQDMKTGNNTQQVVTQKELMVQPNVPRFLRHGDTIIFSSKVSNLTDQEQKVTVVLEMKSGERNLDSMIVDNGTREVTIPANSSTAVAFTLAVPDDIFMATYRITAFNERHNDGEQAMMAVLPNRQLVTESMAMYINGKGEKEYKLQHLAENNSTTLQHERLAVEFTSNPIWYAIQSLPYVQQHENPSTLYQFNAFYTLSLAQAIAYKFDLEALGTVAETGKSTLEMNEDIKNIVLEETPWLRDGTDETARIRHIKEYFNKEELNKQRDYYRKQINDNQRNDGSWSWIPDGKYGSTYTTTYILKGMGELKNHLAQLGIQWKRDNKMVNKALDYVEKEELKYYEKYIKNNKYKWEPDNINYLYLCSFYPDHKREKKYQEMYDFYYSNALKHYDNYSSLYTQAQLALIFQRKGNTKMAQKMINRIKERSLTSDEMGMYWRDNRSGWCWYERPIEVQSLIIEAFNEITPDDKESIALMQQWLLKQKQTTRWESDIATTNAITALMVNQGQQVVGEPVNVTVGGQQIVPSDTGNDNPSGYMSQRWNGEEVTTNMAEVKIEKRTDGIAWGALYWQYFEDMNKIESSAMGIRLKREYFLVQQDGSLTPLAKVKNSVKVGDRIRVRILIECDRALDHLQLKDGRAGGFEPVSTTSGWLWNDGISYFLAVGKASNTFFIEHIDKGRYMAEYDVWANNAGTFTLAPAEMQCLYSPSFRANSEGVKIKINEK